MANRTRRLTAILLTAALLAVAAVMATSAAQKDSVPKPQNKLALGEKEVKQLLLLMEPDKQGKVSKQQFMQFMEAEFEHLDTAKKGELDVKQLTQTTVSAKNFVGK